MTNLVLIGIVAFILIALLGVLVSKYRTVGPEEALIVTGSLLGKKNVNVDASGNKVKIIRGGGTLVLPVLQQAVPLSLLSSKLDVKTNSIYTVQGVPVEADGVAIIKIGGSIEEIATAAEQFLGKTKEDRENEAKEILEGHLRGVLSTMEIENINKNRQEFSQKVLEYVQQDLAKMGLMIVSFTIKDLRDKNGYLEALGKPRIAQVKRDADVALAEADKETRIAQAEADKDAQKSELERATEVAEAQKQNVLKVAEFKREQDSAKARADQAYALEEARAKKDVKEQEMNIEIVERQKQIELAEKEITHREKQYEADVKLKAVADRYAVVQEAEAKKEAEMAQADGEKYQIEAMAKAFAEKVRLEGEAKASAEKVQGLAEADIIKSQGVAAADVIRAKGIAEAEAKEKIAEAFAKYDEAAKLDMIIKMLPEYAKEIAAPMGNIDKISVIDMGGNGKNGGATKVAGYTTELMTSLQETLKESSGIDIKELLTNFSKR